MVFIYTRWKFLFYKCPFSSSKVVSFHEEKFDWNFTGPRWKRSGASKPIFIENYGEIGIFKPVLEGGVEAGEVFP